MEETRESIAKEYGVPQQVAAGDTELEMRESAESFRQSNADLYETDRDRELKRRAAATGLQQLRESENRRIINEALRRNN